MRHLGYVEVCAYIYNIYNYIYMLHIFIIIYTYMYCIHTHPIIPSGNKTWQWTILATSDSRKVFACASDPPHEAWIRHGWMQHDWTTPYNYITGLSRSVVSQGHPKSALLMRKILRDHLTIARLILGVLSDNQTWQWDFCHVSIDSMPSQLPAASALPPTCGPEDMRQQLDLAKTTNEL